GAGALILALHDHQIFVPDLDTPRGARPAAGRLDRPRLPLHGVQQRARRIEVQRVAELVRLRRAGRLDAGRLFARIVPAVAALAERSEQVPQRAVAEEVE